MKITTRKGGIMQRDRYPVKMNIPKGLFCLTDPLPQDTFKQMSNKDLLAEYDLIRLKTSNLSYKQRQCVINECTNRKLEI